MFLNFFVEGYYLDKLQSPWWMVDKSSLFNLAGYRLFQLRIPGFVQYNSREEIVNKT